ncbi:Protein RCR2 [Lachnellula occidentalis]|uniref:Protein RCR2 n=1 Tax=Lachnellula occidentalis TaxID=215460 RepID=A0A8H8RUK3_9HELO|nr:Protein RCR2 [Lachnellula occidentalis]
MAPTTVHSLIRRYYCDDDDDNFGDCNNYSSWNSWGRWVALVVIVLFFLLVALSFSCYNNRRRRTMGAPPMYGTGWMPAPKYNQQQNGYYAGHGGPAPPYSTHPVGNQATGTTFNSNDGYYGHHGGQGNGGIELQPPQNVYTQPQRETYEAPMGPPPGKGDGIIR